MSIDPSLKVAALSLDIVEGDIAENLYNAARVIDRVDRDTDLIVLPEVFSSGWQADPDFVAAMAQDFESSETLAAVRQWAAQRHCAVAGSMLTRDGEHIYNRAFFVEPSGEVSTYDKHHLFSPGLEKTLISAGNKQSPVIRFRGWNISLAVCYDLRFPVWARNKGMRYDLQLYPANWPVKRVNAWKTLLAARAIENLSYVVGTNRSGTDQFGSYDNMTVIYDYMGREVGNTPMHGEDTDSMIPDIIRYATLDKVGLNKFRHDFPVYLDADDFVIR
jgi:predicted amidohydrolase